MKHKPLNKEVEEDTRKQKDIPCSWIGRINILKMTILPKDIYRFKVIPIKFQFHFSQKQKNMLKFILNHKRPSDSQNIPEKKC